MSAPGHTVGMSGGPLPAVDPYAGGPGEDVSAAALGWQVGRLARLMQCLRSRMKSEASPEGSDLHVLAFLATLGPHRLTDLAGMTGLDVSTLSRQTQSMVKRGLLERRPNPRDGRGTLLAVTDDGTAAFEAYRRQRSRLLSALLADWSEADRALCTRLLERLNNDFERHGELMTGSSWRPRLPETSGVAAMAGEEAT